MKRRAGYWLCPLVALLASITCAGLQGQENEGVAIKSVHLFDLPPGLSRAEIEVALATLNRAVSSTGHTGAGYQLWEVNQAQVAGYPSIGYDFVMEGVWPSQAAYDEIHQAPSFRAAIEEHGAVLQAISDASAYSRYQRVRLGG